MGHISRRNGSHGNHCTHGTVKAYYGTNNRHFQFLITQQWRNQCDSDTNVPGCGYWATPLWLKGYYEL